MASATSFLNHLGGRPPRYRTPSPPRRAIEPISPSSTTDFRIMWNERSAFRPTSSERDQYTFSDGGYGARDDDGRQQQPAPDGGAHHRAGGHGRSGSTIDTLATIALATSPTFAPLSYPSAQNAAPANPPPPSDARESVERPAKRARSEKGPSPALEQHDAKPASCYDSVPDSMKTDAELLLNFARPSNFRPIPDTSKPSVSIDESYRHGSDTKWQTTSGYASAGHSGMDEDKSAYAFAGNGVSSWRTRSWSDGSAAVSRPVMQGVRPNTSCCTLPSISWQDEDVEDGCTQESEAQNGALHAESQPVAASETDAVQSSTTVLPKTEEEEDSDDSSQANCAACNLVRIPTMDGEEEGEITWINCDGCKRWFHIVCAGFKDDREVRTVDKFICRGCRPIYGPTTFVRKSSRARTAIDYAGLNQGLVKTSTETHEHHYIRPIKEGKIQFLPENFPRMRPELVTAEYFERGNGMTEPIVIPASLNTRESVPPVQAEFDALVQDAPTQEMFDELLEHLPDERDGGYEEVIDCGQDLLDMVIPQGLTVRRVAELYGPEERVEVIDVKSQQGEEKKWNMQKWADYYESAGPKVVRNVISLEVSQSKLGRLLRRPKIVRDLDLQDAVWPAELKAVGDYPKVQFYCLMSVADCFTDFHIDFGGSSVFYHILKGKKTFFFIPPKEKHLKKYEEWCNSPAQDTTFLGDQTKECYRVDLSEGDTMLIPAGWIHAVWTPENSLVIGGNFLTRMSYGMQIKVAKIEKDTKVPRKFRYPFFQKIQWYAALKYLEEDPIPGSVLEAFTRDENYRFHRDYPIYYEFGERANTEPPGSSYYNARYYSQAELEGLPDLAKYLLRTALIAGGYAVDGVTQEDRNAVKRSIPKGTGDPIETVRKFGIWVAWKRGNEPAPQWTRPGAITLNAKVDLGDKKPAGRPSRRSERTAESQRMYAERQAVRRPSDQLPDQSNGVPNGVSVPSGDSAPIAPKANPASTGVKEEASSKPRNVQKGSGLGPKRVACDACRKRRIRCRHKDEQNDTSSLKFSAKQATTDAFASDMSLQNQSALAHDAASALNSLAAVATEASLQAAGNMQGVDRFDGKINPALLGTSHPASSKPNDLSPNNVNAGKKGRSKACDECRKSKRRCIHDEYGRIDPIKAQERSKPRGTGSAKRPRPVDEGATSEANKKSKQDIPPEAERTESLVRKENGVAAVQAAQMVDAANGPVGSESAHLDTSNVKPLSAEGGVPEGVETEAALNRNSYASPPAFKADKIEANEVTSMPVPAEPATSLVSPPTSLADEGDIPPERADGDARPSVEGEQEGEQPTTVHTPTSGSRHSSRQPRQVDRYVPESQPVKAAKSASQSSSARGPSGSATATGTQGKTPPAPPPAGKKPSSRPSSSHAKKSTSPAHPSKSVKRDRASFAESETDLESLRLIRELHEQDFGLRKRGTRI